MANTAVLSELDVTIEKLHLNLWILPGLFRQVRFFDLGIQFMAGKELVRDLSVVVPCSGVRAPTDLSPFLTNEGASLIFGAPMERTNTHGQSPDLIKPSNGSGGLLPPFSVAAISNFEIVKARESNSGSTTWKLSFARPWSQDDGPAYCRMRFFAADTGRMWTFPGVSPLDGRSMLDLRVLDVRESVASASTVDIRHSGKPVRDVVNAHLIVPEEYEVLDYGENHQYVRLLETDAWSQYLGRRASFPGTRPKMLTISWKKGSDEQSAAAEINRPARFGCMLRKYTLSLALSRLVIAVMVAAVIAWFLIGNAPFAGGADDAIANWLAEEVPGQVLDSTLGESGTVQKGISAVVSVPVVGLAVLLLIISRIDLVRKWFFTARTAVESFLVDAQSHGRY